MKRTPVAISMIQVLLLLLGATVSSMVFSASISPEKTNGSTAHQILEVTTQRLTKAITEAQGYYLQDPDRFYQEIETILDEVVDFKSFARGVMGKYGSSKAYKALSSDDEKQAFKARITRFTQYFRESLVKTYAKGLLAFNGNRIDVLPPAEGEVIDEAGSVTVVQHIYGSAPKPFVVRYKMKRDRSGEWKLRNMTIEAINLGKVYRAQFDSSARMHKGDIDKVIDNWTVDPGGRR